MPSQFAADMGEMVKASSVSESKKTLAMNYVRETGRLANGSRGSVEAICDAFVAQTPILLEMYLADTPTKANVKQVVAEAVQHHIKDCPLKIEEMHSTMKRRKSDTGATDWKRLSITALSNIGWPGALLGMVYFVSEMVKFILSRS
jgi:hypothetical protein